jgi:hypothetical protein
VLDAICFGIGHGRAEEDLLQSQLLPRVDHDRAVQALGQIAHAAVDLAQALLAILIVGIL